MQVRITVQSTLPASVNKAIADFDRKQAAVLQEIGQAVLSRQQLSFEKKSRGGVGDDGIKWAPLAESTLKRRKNLQKDKKAKEKRVKKLKSQLKKAKTKEERSRLLKTIQAESKPVSHQIGVDTGMMRNTVTPGYKAGDGKGDNIFQIEGAVVTVGYGREYAPWFDEGSERVPARPLMPEKMPQQWLQAVEKIVEDWSKDIVSELEK